jgi:CRISPR system Cascade subunit CasD
MSTLLIRLAGPMQSWGMDAKFDRRDTQRAPTKSGVIGLVASALGRRRNESLDDLNALRFGVRTDREGTLLRDYHTAKSEKSAYVTTRYYLCDAVFLAGLEGAEALLHTIATALRAPAFPLFLGRRSCPPEGKVLLGVRTGKSLLQAMEEEPWLASEWIKEKRSYKPSQSDALLRISADAGPGAVGAYFTRDVPVSFDQTHRKYGFRQIMDYTTHIFLAARKDAGTPVPEPSTHHDPMQGLEG